MGLLISLIITLVIIGLILWIVGQLPIDPQIRKIIHVVVVVFVLLWLLSLIAGIAPAPHWIVVR